MANRRESVHEYYRRLPGGQVLLEKSAAAAPQFPFKGASIEHAVIVRTDLNGYSAWARDRSAADRAAQLDAFFSRVVPQIELAGGVFFRDEGDCILSLFSAYFDRNASYKSIRSFCKSVTNSTYGKAQLSAKSCVSAGDVAFFQKQHEIASGDWSAEGEPFVRAARLEAAVSSIKHVCFLEEEYDRHFAETEVRGAPGKAAPWTIVREALQVPGLGAAGGWVRVVRLEHDS